MAMRACVVATLPLVTQIVFVPLLIGAVGFFQGQSALIKKDNLHQKFLAKHIEHTKSQLQHYLLIMINLLCLTIH